MNFLSSWHASEYMQSQQLPQMPFKYGDIPYGNAYSLEHENENVPNELVLKVFLGHNNSNEVNQEVSNENQTTASENNSMYLQKLESLTTISDCSDDLFFMNRILEENCKKTQKYFEIKKDFSRRNSKKLKNFHNVAILNLEGYHLFKVLTDKRFNRLRNSINNKVNYFNENFISKGKDWKKANMLKQKMKLKRKFKPDDIRKKIKARFHKMLKNLLNACLLKAGSKKTFDFLPQCFLSNISKKVNYYAMSLTMRELYEFDFCKMSTVSRIKNKNIDQRKLANNLEVLDYLDMNPDICEKSGFNRFAQKSYCDMLNEYFMSEEFLHSVKRLKYEKESDDYISEYKKKALGYVTFFSTDEMFN